MIDVALFGNPNVGKTTLFNALTGSNQYVGNWPGVTIDKRKGFFNNVQIMDLPGIYAFDTFSNEERVSKEAIINDNPDVILNIVDASNLNRNLYLTMQLKQFNKPIIVALNMIDLCEKKGIHIDYKKLEEELEVEIIPISAGKNIGIDKIRERLIKGRFKNSYCREKFLHKDEEEVYRHIEDILKKTVIYDKNSHKQFNNLLDKLLLNPVMAFPFFISVMVLIFKITFTWVGRPLSDLLSQILTHDVIPLADNILSNNSQWFRSLVINGIISGVGGVLTLLPIITVMFVCITILEDSGYMARIAFIMDKLMRKMGLSGKAFIPMVIGFGCSVPAVMSARTLESEKDRKLAALLVPFMSCNARLPVYLLFASVFFRGNEGIVIASLYLMGVFTAFVFGILLSGTVFKKEEEPFLIEIPEYRLPKISNIINAAADKAIEFVKKAGSLIFAMSVIIWFLSNFDYDFVLCNVNESILATVGSKIAPVFKYVGFGNWESAVSLLCGLLAKETVLSSMQVIYGGSLETALLNSFNSVSAYAFLTFVLLYIPCISTCGTIKKEYGLKFMIISMIFQFGTAWSVSFCVFNVGSIIVKLFFV